jgi:sugar O-acyltransferase (sialic acid O-acetyltransferase NeuD family)
MSSRDPIFLFGAGGHARSVFEIVHRQGRYEVTIVLDDDPPSSSFRDVPVAGGRELLGEVVARGTGSGFVAIGDNADRRLITELALEAGAELVTLVDPSAVIARDVTIGTGTVVMPGVVVNTGAMIGAHAILNTSCTIDHDCAVEDYAHISPGAHLSGECRVGEAAHVGIGASVIQTLTIGPHATVGAGAVVVEDVPEGAVVVGIPARAIEPIAQ